MHTVGLAKSQTHDSTIFTFSLFPDGNRSPGTYLKSIGESNGRAPQNTL